MDTHYFDRLWVDHQPDQNGMADYWNRRAASFNAHKSQDAAAGGRRRELVDRLAEKAGLGPESRVLDIGCGTGHYSFLLARHAGEVTGLDIADTMVEFARRNAMTEGCGKAGFEVVDWKAVDLRRRGWEKRFDFVLASRTPAVNSRAALEKMMAASRGSCCFISRVELENSVHEHLKPLIDWDERKVRVSRASYCAFNILWLIGYSPEVWYIEQNWDDHIGFEDALMLYLRYFESVVPVRADQKQAIRDKLTAMAVDGRIREEVRSRTAVLFWQA